MKILVKKIYCPNCQRLVKPTGQWEKEAFNALCPRYHNHYSNLERA
jgi:hypothetical protein